MGETVQAENYEQQADFRQLENMAEELEPGNTEQDMDGEQGAAVDDLPTDQVLLMAIGPLFDVICPNWNVSPEEKQALAGAYAPVVDKYFGGVSMGVELQAVAITAMILAPRIGTPRVAKPEKKEESMEQGVTHENQ
jgi:hypothetical protein